MNMGSENDFDGSEDASESESQGSGTYSEISGSELDEEISWVEWFCNLKGNEYFVEVDEDYVQDDFNLTGLANIIPFFDHALNMILDIEDNDSDVAEPVPDEQYPLVESAAQMLYGMIHARYVLTTRGLQAMLEKYQACLYGQCPNVLCENQPMMPIGLSDNLRHSAAKVYCPRCQEVYQPRSSRLNTLDGAYFGTTLAPLFFMTYADTVPTTVRSYYVPRIYGFKVSSTVKDRLRLQKQKKLAGHAADAASRGGVSVSQVGTGGGPALAPGSGAAGAAMTGGPPGAERGGGRESTEKLGEDEDDGEKKDGEGEGDDDFGPSPAADATSAPGGGGGGSASGGFHMRSDSGGGVADGGAHGTLQGLSAAIGNRMEGGVWRDGGVSLSGSLGTGAGGGGGTSGRAGRANL